MSVGRRNQGIDVLRGLAILLVLLHHFMIAYPLNDTVLARLFGWEALRAIARNGNYGVTLFFVISGYLITANADRRWTGLENIKAGTFYALRAARILPCLLLLLVVVNGLAAAGVTIFQNHGPAGAPVSFWLVNAASLSFWMNILIIREGWVNYPLGVLWSLSVEEVFYLFFPLVCLALRRKSRLFLFWGALILLGPVYRLSDQGEAEGYLYAFFACFDAIAIGCCTAVLAPRLSLRGRAATLGQIAVATAMAVLYLGWPIRQTNVLGVTAMALGTAVLLVGAHSRSLATLPPKRRLGTPLAWFGRQSYELYLFHLLVLGGLRTLFPPRMHPGDARLALLVVFFLLSAAGSAQLTRYFAEPLNRSLRRRLGLESRGADATKDRRDETPRTGKPRSDKHQDPGPGGPAEKGSTENAGADA